MFLSCKNRESLVKLNNKVNIMTFKESLQLHAIIAI